MHAPRWWLVEPRTRTLLPGVLLGLWLLGVTGCASERQRLLERGAAHVTYRLPSEQLLDVARELLKEDGFLILESTDPNYVRTDWRVKFDDTLDIGALKERHLVMSKQLEDGRCVLAAYRMTYTTIGRTEPHPASYMTNDKTGMQRMVRGDPLSYARPVLERDLALEWRVLSRVSPSVAHELEAQADAYLGSGAR
jgi:hypothetical protein